MKWHNFLCSNYVYALMSIFALSTESNKIRYFIMNKVIAVLAFVFIGVSSVSSQNLSSEPAPATKSISTSEGWLMNGEVGSKVIFLDLEKISVNVTNMTVHNEKGEVVRQESLQQLPVDSIYEVDYSALPAGNYTLEVHSYTGSLNYKFSVK